VTAPRDIPLTYCKDCGKFVEQPLLHVIRAHRDDPANFGKQLLNPCEYDHAIAVIYDWITRLSTT
jgi:hypothetical protein